MEISLAEMGLMFEHLMEIRLEDMNLTEKTFDKNSLDLTETGFL